MTRRRRLPSVCMLSLLSVACLLYASARASAAYDPIAGGTTRIAFASPFAHLLAREGIKVEAAGGASRRGRGFTLPVDGGKVDPLAARGSVAHEGSIVFSDAHGSIPLRQLTVRFGTAPVIAKLGGGQLKVATSAATSFARKGFDSRFSARALKLSAKAAIRLNKKLRPVPPLAEGQLIGTLVTVAAPQVTSVRPLGAATLVFDEAFTAKLTANSISLNPIFPAEHQGGSFSLPIAGGVVAPDGSEGRLKTDGSIELLQLGGGQIFWHEPWVELGSATATAEVDLEPTPALPGKIGRTGVFATAARAFAADPAARTVSLTGSFLTLEPETAASMNEAFGGGKELFAPGEGVGSLDFTARGQ